MILLPRAVASDVTQGFAPFSCFHRPGGAPKLRSHCMIQPASDDPSLLRAQLDEVSRREAWFRLKTVQDFQVLDARIAALKQRVDALSDELGQRNTYIHELHAERDAANRAHNAALAERDTRIHALHQEKPSWAAEAAAARADVAAFIQRIQQAEAERDIVQNRMRQWRSSPLWWIAKKFINIRAPEVPAPALPPVPSEPFTYFLHTSPFRVFHAPSFTLRGWGFPTDGRAVTGIRATLGQTVIPGRIGLPEPEVIAAHGPLSNNPQPGFAIELPLTAGRHELTLEAKAGERWITFLRTPIWVEAAR